MELETCLWTGINTELKHKHELEQQRIGSRQGIDSKCTLHVIHKSGHKGYVVLASLFWYKMHTTWLHIESMGMEHLTFVTMHLLLLKVVFAQVFTLYKIQLGKYLLQISYTHFEPTSDHSLGLVSTLTNKPSKFFQKMNLCFIFWNLQFFHHLLLYCDMSSVTYSECKPLIIMMIFNMLTSYFHKISFHYFEDYLMTKLTLR
jgi:hypothetical protein